MKRLHSLFVKIAVLVGAGTILGSIGAYAYENLSVNNTAIPADCTSNCTFAGTTAVSALTFVNATGTSLNLNAGGNISVAGVNAKKTLTLSSAGCNAVMTNGSVTSSLAYFGQHVFRSSQFQPLTWNGCELDWYPPDSWDGSTMDCKFHYYVTSTDNNGMTWGIQAQGMGTGGALSTGFSGATATVTTVATTTNALTATTGTTLTVGGQTADPELVKIRLTRSNVGASTNTGSLLDAKCEYSVNTFSD